MKRLIKKLLRESLEENNFTKLLGEAGFYHYSKIHDFKVTIVTEQFEGLMLIKRHRLVNKALEQELQQIHALALHTMTASEWTERGGSVTDSPPCKGGGKNQ